MGVGTEEVGTSKEILMESFARNLLKSRVEGWRKEGWTASTVAAQVYNGLGAAYGSLFYETDEESLRLVKNVLTDNCSRFWEGGEGDTNAMETAIKTLVCVSRGMMGEEDRKKLGGNGDLRDAVEKFESSEDYKKLAGIRDVCQNEIKRHERERFWEMAQELRKVVLSGSTGDTGMTDEFRVVDALWNVVLPTHGNKLGDGTDVNDEIAAMYRNMSERLKVYTLKQIRDGFDFLVVSGVNKLKQTGRGSDMERFVGNRERDYYEVRLVRTWERLAEKGYLNLS